jgi:phosphoribosylaminoimidazolecarboxamide formyltransferase / IMP cyclohydrolase
LVLETKNLLFTDCCASYKHNSPAGVAIADVLTDVEQKLYNVGAFGSSSTAAILLRTRNIDPKSSFGDIVGYSGVVDKEMAIVLKRLVSDGIIAANYTDEALEILKTKKDGKYLIVKQSSLVERQEYRDVNGVTLVQPTNDSILDRDILQELPDHVQTDMILGYTTLKYTQSNSVCFVYKGRVIGIGAGQQNRVDCIRIAGDKAKQWLTRHKLEQDVGLTLISDAFLPFADNVEVANEYHVKYILQPGGSIRDFDIEEACKKYGIQMILSNQRVFTH